MPSLKGQILFIMCQCSTHTSNDQNEKEIVFKAQDAGRILSTVEKRTSGFSMVNVAKCIIPSSSMRPRLKEGPSKICAHTDTKFQSLSIPLPARMMPWKPETHPFPQPRRACFWRPIAVDSSKLQQHDVPKRLHGER